MRDKLVDSNLRLLRLQLDNWRKLHELMSYALDKAKPIISVEQEREFTVVRGNLLQETQHALEELSLVHELSSRAMNVLNRGSSMRVVRELSPEDGRRLEMEWNAIFTKLGVAQGQMKSRRRALAEQNIFTYCLSVILRRPLSA
ncbi:MAG: hypothetical protein JO354_03385 [Verrucomicrobia bacterium]|nr:hypothetical protein [Verrucomicrobiota bacterium]